jgi:hypothetical protein
MPNMTPFKPIHPLQRSAFLQSLAKELELHPIVGPGLVHRLAAELQRRFVVQARTETGLAARRGSARPRADGRTQARKSAIVDYLLPTR